MFTFRNAILILALSAFQLQCGVLFESPGLTGRLSPFDEAGVPISFTRVQYVYSGQFSASAKGQPIYSVSFLQTQRGFIYIGDLKIKGKITPSVAGSQIPSKMRIALRLKNPQNALLRSKNFDLTVGADGVILLQTFRHRDAIIFGPKDVLEVNVISVDKAFPAGTANFTLNYVPPAPGT